MTRFDHEKLDVYSAALDFVAFANDAAQRLPPGTAHIADQLRRAGISIPLNIAEGAGEFSTKEKARFYRMAKRSATECAAVLDVCSKVGLEKEFLESGREVLLRIVAMLTRMVRGAEEAGAGSGARPDQRSGTGTGTDQKPGTGSGTGSGTRPDKWTGPRKV